MSIFMLPSVSWAEEKLLMVRHGIPSARQTRAKFEKLRIYHTLYIFISLKNSFKVKKMLALADYDNDDDSTNLQFLKHENNLLS